MEGLEVTSLNWQQCYRFALYCGLSLSSVAPACPQLSRILKGPDAAPSSSGADAGKIGSGLKEALAQATGGAVQSTGRTDGYFKNEAIKILMPDQLKMVEKGARMAGMSGPMDEFVLSMNRAAEQAAPAAKPIFLAAIQSMTFEDAHKILSGSDTAATDYFRGKTTAELTEAFRPKVAEAMQGVGVVGKYQELTKSVPAMPFAKPASFDLENYVVSKAIEGLFHMVGEGEKNIRKDPAGQASALLREVFGH